MLSIPNQTAVLGSWKEIASYLGKGVRTVQRWEQELGLPVRRPNATAKGVVCSSREELDRWLASAWAPRPRDATSAVENSREELRVNIKAFHALHHANHKLVCDLSRSVDVMRAEFEALAVRSARQPSNVGV